MMKLRHSALSIAAGPVWLEAMQAHAPDAPGLILVAQTAVGRHRDSREAHFVQRLQQAGYATLLFDLLTRYEESRDPDTRYNAPLLGTRIGAVFEWLRHQPPLTGLPIGLVASGTGSAAAVRAVAKEPEMIGALVCRGGRPGLAGIGPLRQLSCPTRVIAGDHDDGEHEPDHRQRVQFGRDLVVGGDGLGQRAGEEPDAARHDHAEDARDNALAARLSLKF